MIYLEADWPIVAKHRKDKIGAPRSGSVHAPLQLHLRQQKVWHRGVVSEICLVGDIRRLHETYKDLAAVV